MREIQKGRDAYYEHLVAGHASKQILLKYKRADERILNIVQQFGTRDRLENLRGLHYEIH